jgi:hypothetical protein
MNNEKANLRPQEQFRVVIDREANDALETFVTHVNSNMENSRITKSELANYVFKNMDVFLDDADIAAMRALYFDAKRALEGILKGAGSGEDLPQNLREALLKHCGIKPTTKEKQAKKLSTPKLVDNSKVG